MRLAASLEGSVFQLASVEEEPDRVVIEIGDVVAHVGPPVWGSPPEPRGYAFPD